MLIDYHIHNHFSSDSKANTEEIVKKATTLGIDEICITNHIETFDVNTGKGNFIYDEAIERFSKVQDEINEIQKKFPNLKIKFGAELEYVKEWMNDMKRFVDVMDFDYLIGSVHVVDGVVISSSKKYLSEKLYLNNTEEYSYKKYFELLLNMMEWGHFSAVGHFDVFKRSGNHYYGKFEPTKYESQIKEILTLMKEKGIGMELNTSGLKSDLNEILPETTITKWAVEIGVEHFIIGSDAHKAEEVGGNLGKAIDLAKKAGITTLSSYSKMKPSKFKI